MFDSRWVLIAAAFSFSALGKVSFVEKQRRIDSLMELQKGMMSFNLDAYQRELSYEQKNLPLDLRAKAETNLLATTVQKQIHLAYQAAIDEGRDHDSAIEEVKSGIDNDLQKIAPALRGEIERLSHETLSQVTSGGYSQPVELPQVEKVMYQTVSDRHDYLNNDAQISSDLPTVNTDRDAEKKEYASKAELVASLVSDKGSTRWVSSANMSLRSSALKKTEQKISLQISTEFLGASISAGPVITFKREYATTVSVMGEGLNPILLQDGNFDVHKRDANGKVLMKNGKPQRRFVAFNCEADLSFESEYRGEGGFKVMGMGAEASYSKIYVNTVDITSRRVNLPDYVAGKSVTLKFLSEVCHNDFLNAKFDNRTTVAHSLNTLMKNVVSSLTFTHPKTKCVTDEQCFNWYNREIIALARVKNYPRCVEERREKFYSCALRGLEGQKCAVYKNGKRVSDGMFEFVCDKGLKCVQTKEGGWLRNWELYEYPEGQCRPVDRRTYRSPLDSQYIEIELAN